MGRYNAKEKTPNPQSISRDIRRYRFRMSKIMPKYVVSFIAILILGVSCKEDQGTELFVIPHVLDLEIVAGLNTLDTHIYRFYPYQSQYDNVLQGSGFTNEDVLRVVGKSAEFGSIFSDVDLDFIREISVQIFDKDDPSNKREVFFLDPVPGNAGKIIYPFRRFQTSKNSLMPPVMGSRCGSIFGLCPTKHQKCALSFYSVRETDIHLQVKTSVPR